MKKIICLVIAAAVLCMSASAMTVNEAFDEIKADFPGFVERLNRGGAADGDIINFLEDVSEYLKEKKVKITDENVDSVALEAIQKVIYYADNLPVYEALTKEFTAEALYFVANNKLPESLMPLYDAAKKILLESPELWKEQDNTNKNENGTSAGTSDNTPGSAGRFSDLSGAQWAAEAINALADEGVINGYEDGTFRPNNQITRAEFTKIMVTVLGIEPEQQNTVAFTDVKIGDWFYPYVAGAVEFGLIKGYDTGEFKPNQHITREDICVIVYRAAQSFGLEFEAVEEAVEFTDKNDISVYATEAIAEMQRADILNGMGDGRFAPKEGATRAQAAKIIYMAFI